MMQSYYWKKDLIEHAKKLKPKNKPRKWSEKLMVNFEKELIISFFCIRRLFELDKLSNISKKYKATIYKYKSIGKKITKLNQSGIDEIYDLDKGIRTTVKITFLCNQFIHNCTIFAYRNEDRNWSGVYLCSNLERNKNIYRVPVEEIINVFNTVGNDYPKRFMMKYNEEKNDYIVTID